LEQHGYLSGLIIDELECGPSSSAYRTRFGSLIRAYELIGFTPARAAPVFEQRFECLTHDGLARCPRHSSKIGQLV
jgi:hypothetical protein